MKNLQSQLENILEEVAMCGGSEGRDECLTILFSDVYEWCKDILTDTEQLCLRVLLEHTLAELGVGVILK